MTLKGTKMTIFGELLRLKRQFFPLYILDTIFDARIVTRPKQKLFIKTFEVFPHPWCNTLIRYGSNFIQNLFCLIAIQYRHIRLEKPMDHFCGCNHGINFLFLKCEFEHKCILIFYEGMRCSSRYVTME